MNGLFLTLKIRRGALLVKSVEKVGRGKRSRKEGTKVKRELKWKQIHMYIFLTLRKIFFFHHVFGTGQKYIYT